ncbi:MAG: response regulator, partial [Proteobacteria bacterium]
NKAALFSKAIQALARNREDIPCISIARRHLRSRQWAIVESFGFVHDSDSEHCAFKIHTIEFATDDDEVCLSFGLTGEQALDKSHEQFLVQLANCLQSALAGVSRHEEFARESLDQKVQLEKELEELQQAVQFANDANKLKTSFLANMSHEIRTPLSAMLGYTELLRDAQLSSAEGEYLNVISKNGEALTHLIDDILDLSKVEAGKLTIDLKPFDLKELAIEVQSLFERKAREKGLYLTLSITETMPQHICSDCSRIRQILINIVGNALKFTQFGGVSVLIEPKSSVKAGGKFLFVVRVKDTGAGLEEFQKNNLFQPFVQLEHTQAVHRGGSGLGLALSRRLARSLGGDIQIETSVLGEGSTFVIELTAEIVREKIKTECDPVEPLGARLKGLKILIIEDSPDNRYLLSRILRMQGAVITEAVDGEEGVEKAMQNDFDIVLMDIQMPRMDGFEALAYLRAQKYDKPVIALTAHAMKEER